MGKTLFFTAILALSSIVGSYAQTSKVIIDPYYIRLPKDSVEKEILATSLNSFLEAIQKPNEQNQFVATSELVSTFILLDEMKNIQQHPQLHDDHFFKTYLTNIVPIGKDTSYLQLAYIGIKDGAPLLRANFNLYAYRNGQTFSFASPLLHNTKYWKTLKVGNTIFHYRNSLNQKNVKAYEKLVAAFDQKLKTTNKQTEIYCSDNFVDAQSLIGIGHKIDYNGRSGGSLNSANKDATIIVLGDKSGSFDTFDPHDLWHDRLSLTIDRSKTYRPVDEGCAYLYGGSWGLTWEQIFKEFKAQVASNPQTNWNEIKDKPLYFKTNGYNNNADNIVNALLVKKIEKEKGFAGVWELLTIGPATKDNDKYYPTLQKLTGITKDNYNENVWELIKVEE